ncbi:DUF2715 domain-containing protein [Treponema vincentii]|uniref:DUF2715 domain-containing protein n=1 Tax=Treponema vincentii TaxID=69710 RepID=UPI003D8E83D3
MHKFYFILLLCFFCVSPCFSQETAPQSNDTAEVEHREHDTSSGQPNNTAPLQKKHAGFDEYLFAPALGMGIGFELPTSKNTSEFQFVLGPSIKFDMQFSLRSGFSFLLLNEVFFPLAYITYNVAKKDSVQMGYIPVWHGGVLFGYTHGVKTDVEITAAGGLGVMLILPELITQLSISKFFTEKYGLYFTLNNKFVFLPAALADDGKMRALSTVDVTLGASFRIYPKERSVITQPTVKPKKQRKRVFEEYVFAPSFALSTVFLGMPPDLYIIMGPSLNLDMIFTKEKSGFSFFIHNNTAVWFTTYPKDPDEPGPKLVSLPLTLFHFMFGYTHGRGSNFEISAGIGPGFALSPVHFFRPVTLLPAVSTEIAFTTYFSKKYGLYISALNSFIFIPFGSYRGPDGKRKSSYLFIDMLNISIGPSFRL